MATELISRTWCDVHLEEKDEREPAESFTVQVTREGERAVVRVIDLCESCATILAPVAALIGMHGRKLTAAGGGKRSASPQPAATYACPDCGVEAKSSSALTDHQRRKHGQSKTDGLRTDDGLYQCPDCDKTSPSPQGIGAHRRTHKKEKAAAA